MYKYIPKSQCISIHKKGGSLFFTLPYESTNSFYYICSKKSLYIACEKLYTSFGFVSLAIPTREEAENHSITHTNHS